MQYREIGKTGLRASLLGMGCMRLPFVNGDGNQGVDRELAFELLRHAADSGINYFDTAFGYHGGQSEAIMGEALESRRKDLIYVTKQPPWEMHDIPTIRRNLENTLKKLRTDYMDIYLMHRVMPATWDDIKEKQLLKQFEIFKEEGLIRHIGCSYHGNYEHFTKVAQEYPWEVCKVQHNMLDMKREATKEGIEFAGARGIGVAIMEPLRGGGLAYAPPVVQKVYDASEHQRSPAEWAFRYLADIPEISVIVSGMSNMQQLECNLAMFNQADMPSPLSAAEKATITAARQAYESIITINCTACNYCIPCPQGVQIPGIFGNYNDAHRFGHFDQPRRAYMFATRAGGDATKCNACGACVEKCPQGVDVVKDLQTAHEALKGWNE
ncbi:MAG: aldo/keto reductase [Defluviitaleaceae bacterium]|nr:aldo/keto reductase [Defluviitaleaceae bacterium]